MSGWELEYDSPVPIEYQQQILSIFCRSWRSKMKHHIVSIFAMISYALVVSGASELEITSFKTNGTLTWKCNLADTKGFRIEWASSPNGPWASLMSVEGKTGISSAQVPIFNNIQVSMFFRVAAITVPATNASIQSVWGNVFYASTMFPISGVRVSLGGATSTTDSSGKYNLPNVPVGFALIEARKDGYDTYAQTIQVQTRADLNNYDIEMTSGDMTHDLTGNVSDALGNPVDGVVITILNPDGSSSRLVDTTSATGHYQIPSVPQGTRTVMFAKQGYETKAELIHIYDREKVYDLTLRRPPTAKITSPGNESTWFTTQTVTLTAIAEDDAGNPLSGNSLTWMSDLDGILGTGNYVNCQALSQGTHTITLEALSEVCGISTKVDVEIHVNTAPTASDIVGNWELVVNSTKQGRTVMEIILNADFSISPRTVPPRGAKSKIAGFWSLQGDQLSVNVQPIRLLQGGVTSYRCTGTITMSQPLTMSGTFSGNFEWLECFNGYCSSIAGQPKPTNYSFNGTFDAMKN
jgi:hypothetical protein